MYARDYSHRPRDAVAVAVAVAIPHAMLRLSHIYTPIVLKQCHVHRINIMIRIVTIASCTLLASRRLRLSTGQHRTGQESPGSHPASRSTQLRQVVGV